MSGESHVEDCPRCLTKGSMECSSDWKPHNLVSGIRPQCGYNYTTVLMVIPEKDLKEVRADFEEFKPVVLTEEQKEHMKQYDERMGVEK